MSRSNDNLIIQARKASRMSQAEVADLLGMSHPTYWKREHSPALFTIGELQALHAALPNPESKRLLARYVSGIYSAVSF